MDFIKCIKAMSRFVQQGVYGTHPLIKKQKKTKWMRSNRMGNENVKKPKYKYFSVIE